uniref:YeeE/YedE family protein n=1 Tax=Methylotuvimicrobium sp. KM2 TaxID=3133976 RepID=UPI0040484FBE
MIQEFFVENFTPFSAFLGGTLIGLAATLLLWLNGRMAGVSGIMHRLLNSSKPEWLWRFNFLIGLVLGALLFNWFNPGFFTPRSDYPYGLLAVGGFLVGFGTRMGSGCTSGHGICGIANGSLRSITATLIFMISGVVTVYCIRHIVGVGV